MAIIISIEGTDGSGKQTQCEKIRNRLVNNNFTAVIMSFPAYDNESSTFVKNYLNGDYGSITDNKMNEYSASMIFAMDRMISYLTHWNAMLKRYDFVIMDRYVESNLIHQGARIKEIQDLIRYIDWETDFEYNKLNLPRPDITLFLNMTPEASDLLRKNRKNKITGETSQDIHESDKAYQLRSYRTAQVISDMLKWNKIDCTNTSNVKTTKDILSIDDITDKCMNAICKNSKVKRLIRKRED